MKKISLIDSHNNVLGIGYCDESGREALEELKYQVYHSGIRARLIKEDVRDIDMTELGDKMRQYQTIIDMAETETMNNLLSDYDYDYDDDDYHSWDEGERSIMAF